MAKAAPLPTRDEVEACLDSIVRDAREFGGIFEFDHIRPAEMTILIEQALQGDARAVSLVRVIGSTLVSMCAHMKGKTPPECLFCGAKIRKVEDTSIGLLHAPIVSPQKKTPVLAGMICQTCNAAPDFLAMVDKMFTQQFTGIERLKITPGASGNA